MTRRALIDGIFYSLDTGRHVAMVEHCEDREQTGELVIPPSIYYEEIMYMVESIEKAAFQGCSNLTIINIPDGVMEIGTGVFQDCSSLIAINIPASVKRIGNQAFQDCSSLIAINIPASVKRIEFDAFAGCSSLRYIKVAKENRVYDSRNNCNAIIETASGRLIVGCCDTVIPEGVRCIASEAFRANRCPATINIPSSVTSIESGAFSDSSNLTTINIPSSVTSIEGELSQVVVISLPSISHRV